MLFDENNNDVDMVSEIVTINAGVWFCNVKGEIQYLTPSIIAIEVATRVKEKKQ